MHAHCARQVQSRTHCTNDGDFQGNSCSLTHHAYCAQYQRLRFNYSEGVVESTVCFQYNSNGGSPCVDHVQVGVVRCGGFLLWRLPDAPDCDLGYCTAASEL